MMVGCDVRVCIGYVDCGIGLIFMSVERRSIGGTIWRTRETSVWCVVVGIAIGGVRSHERVGVDIFMAAILAILLRLFGLRLAHG